VKVELSDRAHREMQRINASWRKQADCPDLFLDELLETVELIETTAWWEPSTASKRRPRAPAADG
jgi:hypothetical protein